MKFFFLVPRPFSCGVALAIFGQNVTFSHFWAGLTIYMNRLSVFDAVFLKVDVLSTSNSAFLAYFCDFWKILGQKKFDIKILKVFRKKIFLGAKIFFWPKSVGNDHGTLDLCQKSFFEKENFFFPQAVFLWRCLSAAPKRHFCHFFGRV